MPLKKFSQAVCEKIGFYVYILKDPKNGEIFYIGKGKNNRLYNHVNMLIKPPKKLIESAKLDRIKKIGPQNVQHYILRHGLKEAMALEIESACIDLIGLENLENEISGHDSWERGLKTADEVVQYYDAKKIVIEEPTIIININRQFRRFMFQKDLYEATRKSWVVGEDRNKAKYAIASYRGLVREVYKIDYWKKAEGNRWELIGQEAEKSIRDKYLNQSLSKYISHGNQNPIRYSWKLRNDRKQKRK